MIRGWCPGVHEPMPSGDGLLVRVKPPGGRLPARALRAIADAASDHGNGVIELTSRGNLQIRGLSPASAPRFAAAMMAAGLADSDPAREQRRNVIAVPPCDDPLVAEIEALLANLPGLAPKFCVAVGAAEADLVVQDGAIWAEGRRYPYAPATLRSLAEQAGGRRLAPNLRPRAAVDGLLLALPFGQTSAAAFMRLAELTDDARTTPWRALHIPKPADATPFAAAGFIIDPADPRRAIAACSGAPACANATTPTRADAARLAAAGVTGIHVSGCAKGCAQRRPGVTLVGRDGRYDLVANGRASDAPSLTGLSLAQAVMHLAGSA
jgi:precorrin-3B synthase